jgi:hypothetical protein
LSLRIEPNSRVKEGSIRKRKAEKGVRNVLLHVATSPADRVLLVFRTCESAFHKHRECHFVDHVVMNVPSKKSTINTHENVVKSVAMVGHHNWANSEEERQDGERKKEYQSNIESEGNVVGRIADELAC